MVHPTRFTVGVGVLCALFGATVVVIAQPGGKERNLKENEVPPAALAALKKLSGGAAFIELEEETHHGRKVYEAEWNGPSGEMEAKVSEAGDVLELEEEMTAESVPAAVRAAAEKLGDKGAKIAYEKATYVLYEVEFRKNGRKYETHLDASGHQPHGDAEEDDDGDDAGEAEND